MRGVKYIRYIGVYRIQSIIKPELSYIGGTIDITRRWQNHITSLKRNEHDNSRLQEHFNKYGESDLQFSILICCNKDELSKQEQFFLDSHNPLFNICPVVGNVMGGRNHTEESRQKMRKPMSEEAKANMRKPKSDIARAHMSISQKGKTFTEETRLKLSIAAKKDHILRKQNKLNNLITLNV
jgi:group I intron endonuclease